ncbi:MAG: hypothetical protein BVN33_09765 [Proteobacteria bacterium ST_bin13]|nr:MAG: hypothetical protein BVN33_09765 [Proteobacteria bacterium ST_bin13]
MTKSVHCPYRQAALLQQALAPDKMRVAFLLGAGCPVSVRVVDGASNTPLIPDIKGLTDKVKAALESDSVSKPHFDQLIARFGADYHTIEDILSEIRALQNVVRNGQIDGLDQAALSTLDAKICKLTTDEVGVDLPEPDTPYHRFAMWVGGIQRTYPVEIFTPNYDTLVEQALEARRIPYFDGFVGSKEAFFDLTSMENDKLPARWSRLWKVHGSINWWRTASEDVVRREKGGTGDRQMIYPSHLKYDQSRRMPYLAMLDRMRDFLSRGQAVLVTCGYSFADQHLNEIITHGLRSNPTAICFGLLFGERSQYAAAFATARKHPNLSLLAEDGAILGTAECDWRADEKTDDFMHDIGVVKNSGDTNCRFVLGDFKKFGDFLTRQIVRHGVDEDHPDGA